MLTRFDPSPKKELPVCDVKISNTKGAVFQVTSVGAYDTVGVASTLKGQSLLGAKKKYKDNKSDAVIFLQFQGYSNYGSYSLDQIKELIEGLQSMVDFIEAD